MSGQSGSAKEKESQEKSRGRQDGSGDGNGNGQDEELFREGTRKAVELLKRCATEHGFLASPTKKDNYRRVWGRDGSILTIAALMTGESELMEAAERTLRTLAGHQGPHGEIPSNVDPSSGRISYGGMAGRVDSDLWFVVACGEFWKATGDDGFLEDMWQTLEKVRFLLGAWEFNNRGLLYIPQTGDWADEYLQNGYVLYDQLLYLQALRALGAMRAEFYDSPDHSLAESGARLKHLIRDNYWFPDGDGLPDDLYHEILYKKGRQSAHHHAGKYWAPFFTPHGYGYRFAAFANVLVSLVGVADDGRRSCVDNYIAQTVKKIGMDLLPAFYPVITPVDEDWEDLQMTFSYTFKNKPHEFHNGGLWPMITGFYVADLALRGKTDDARRFLTATHKANRMEMEGEPWGFCEFVHGKKHTPDGTRHQAWSAAGALIGQKALEGGKVFRIHAND